MSDHSTGPRPPSDPRLDEVVPIQQPPAAEVEPDQPVDTPSETSADVAAETSGEMPGEALADGTVEMTTDPATMATEMAAGTPVDGENQPEYEVADQANYLVEDQLTDQVDDVVGSVDSVEGPPVAPTELSSQVPLRPFTSGRYPSYPRSTSSPSAASAASVTGEVFSDATNGSAETVGSTAPDLIASTRSGRVAGAAAAGGAAAGVTGGGTVDRVSSAADQTRNPVTTLDVDLRPNRDSEPFRRFAILIAALFLLVGVVVFREWDNRGTATTDSSADEATDTTVEAPVSTPDPNSEEASAADAEDLETQEAAQEEGEGTVTTVNADGGSDDTASDDTASDDTASDDSSSDTTLDGAEVDPFATRGLLESERITLTGAVPSAEQAAALEVQLESVVGEGNVDSEALTIDPSAPAVDQLTLSVADELGFRPGSDTIEASFFPVLDRLIGLFESQPNVVMAVEGHTDSTGLDYENLALSQRRADAVVEYIVAAGVNRFRLEPQGRGSTIPIADNNTEAGRALNRRIEFVVFGLDLPS